PFSVWHGGCSAWVKPHFDREITMSLSTRFLVSPLGRAALASTLALAALCGATFAHHAAAAPLIVASPAAITGELA
ncbi:hypothetical protein, partial [Enterococcus faecalis]|uniref:hypothetical protein n=1 Tax=Enterococcus faecalis TaxID=1351 RepID=UPI00403FAB10